MKLISVGAEAEVHQDGDTILKRRVPKRYRHVKLDEKIRKNRNRKEARLLRKARQAVNVPRLIEAREYELVLERLEGKTLKESGVSGLEETLGEEIGKLHDLGIAHNDLTTSNIMVGGGKIWFIDFGLADKGKTEDFATDLKVLFEAAGATHADFSEEGFIKGYLKVMDQKVLKRLEKIYSRGRYIR